MADQAGTTDTTTPPSSHDCPDCGAPVVHDPGPNRLRCTRWESHLREIVPVSRPIQGHPYERWASESSERIEPEAIVPFTLDQQAATSQLRDWLASRWFAPRALQEVTGADSLQSSYLPHWSFSARVTSDYTGKRGKHYWTTETYTTTDAKGNSTTHTRPVQHTSWRKVSGTVTRDFDGLLVAAGGQLPSGALGKVAPWPVDQAVPYQPEYGFGHEILPYEVELDDGLAQAKTVMARSVEKDCRADIGGDAQRVGSIDSRYSNVTYQLVLFPVWIGSYRYRDKDWQVLVNGCTGRLHGDRPYSVVKIAGAAAAALAVLAAIVALVLLGQAGALPGQ